MTHWQVAITSNNLFFHQSWQHRHNPVTPAAIDLFPIKLERSRIRNLFCSQTRPDRVSLMKEPVLNIAHSWAEPYRWPTMFSKSKHADRSIFGTYWTGIVKAFYNPMSMGTVKFQIEAKSSISVWPAYVKAPITGPPSHLPLYILTVWVTDLHCVQIMLHRILGAINYKIKA